MKMGAVAVPLFTLFGPDGLHLRIKDCTPKILLTTPDLVRNVNPASKVIVHLADQAFLKQMAAQSNEFTPDTSPWYAFMIKAMKTDRITMRIGMICLTLNTGRVCTGIAIGSPSGG